MRSVTQNVKLPALWVGISAAVAVRVAGPCGTLAGVGTSGSGEGPIWIEVGMRALSRQAYRLML